MSEDGSLELCAQRAAVPHRLISGGKDRRSECWLKRCLGSLLSPCLLVLACSCSLSTDAERRTTTYYYGNEKPQFRFETQDGRRTGLFTRWYPDGVIESECERRHGSLLRRCKYFFSDGSPFRETEYSPDGLQGIEREWFSNGTLRSEGRTRQRQRSGTWYFWSRNGEHGWIVEYESGSIVSVEPTVLDCPEDNEIEAAARKRSRHFLSSQWCEWQSKQRGQQSEGAVLQEDAGSNQRNG